MYNPSDSLARAQGNHLLPIKSWCDNHKKELLITIVAIAAISTIIVGILTLLASSHAGLSGLNSLGTPGGASFVTVGGVAFLLAVLSACCFNKQKDLTEDHNHIQDHLKNNFSETNSSVKEEQKKQAVILLQNACRIYLKQSRLQTQQKDKLVAELRARESERVARSTPKFSPYTVEVLFDGDKKKVLIRSADDVEAMVKSINDEIYQTHGSISIYFEGWFTPDRERKERMQCFQGAPSATDLQFSMPPKSGFLCVKAKPKKIEELGDGKTFRIFANGITETFITDDRFYKGTRTFPDGRQEKGKFNEEGKFISGYRIGLDKQIEFVYPPSLISCKSDSEESSLEICEIEEKLLLLEKTYGEYVVSNIPIEEVLVRASQRPKSIYREGDSISKVLLHKDFKKNLHQFIEYALGQDESGAARLFGFSNAAILDVLEAGSKIITINPLKIIDPVSKRNIFVQAAHWGNGKLLNKMIELFPQVFEATAQECVAEFLLQGHRLWDNDKVMHYKPGENFSFYYDFLEKAKLDPFHNMWLQVAKCEKPDENFKKEFALLPSEQKRTLYDAAFTYNNPFIHEPPDLPIRADQYSINLIWINKSKIPDDQEFLFGDGSTIEQRQRDFQEKFITPVAKWAKTNPDSSINIWVDGEMATSGAIEKSHEALQKALEGSCHGTIHFRDVRSIEVVRNNADVFSDRMPVYFRVDLLRAITADHVLRSKETKYFVYGDIDMKPLSGQQLFDKRTVNFLEDFGIVMAKGGYLGFENGFQILNGDNLQCMNSHRQVIIDLSIEMALEKPGLIKEQQIYDTYPAMITHFLDADGRYGKLNLDEKRQKHFGTKIFRYDWFQLSAYSYLPLGNGNTELRNIIPGKPVRLPPSHFG